MERQIAKVFERLIVVRCDEAIDGPASDEVQIATKRMWWEGFF